MTIIIHQAICGEYNKAWDLLKSSMSDVNLAKKIAFKTDLQDSAPGGVSWQPTIRGFLYEDHFLLIKTFPDNSADVRKGRVFSHCLIVSKSDLVNLTDIKELCSHFPSTVEKSIELKPLLIKIDEKNKYSVPEKLVPRFNKVIKGFINLTSYERTIIWVGQDDYESAIFRFWQLLTPSDKENLNFGINFNLNEIPKGKINFITIPESAENKFTNAGFCVVKKNDKEQLTEFSEQFLSGDPSATERLQRFKTAIESRPVNRDEISLLAKGINTFEKLNEITDVKSVNSLSHIIAEFSPDPKKGKDTKALVVDKMCAFTDLADVQNISLIRSFKTKAFNEAESQFSRAIRKWTKKFLFSLKQNKAQNYTSFIEVFLNEKKKDWWSKSFTEELKKYLANINEETGSVIWSWFVNDQKIFDVIGALIDDSEAAETQLMEQLPKDINKTWYSHIKTFSLQKSWLNLYATILKLELDFSTAVDELYKVESSKKVIKALQILVIDARPIEILSKAVSSSDPILMEISGKLCSKNHTLLAGIDVSIPAWQDIWLHAIANGNKIENGISNIGNVISNLLDLQCNDQVVRQSLLEKVVLSNRAKIYSHSKRAKLWNKLPAVVLPKVLSKVVADLYNENVGKDFSVNDNDIKQQILKYGAIDSLIVSLNPSASIWLFKNLKELTESKLIDLLNHKAISFSSEDCKEIGILINQKKFESAFNLINNKLVQKNSNFNQTISLSADAFRKRYPMDVFGILGTYAPVKNFNEIKKTKILFLSANPNSTQRLRVDAELREIDDALQASKYRERFDLIAKGAVKFDTFSKAILENEPEIVHFSGHADKQGIALENRDGSLHAVSNEALDKLFKLFKNGVKCVVMNACYSENQAKLISSHGIYVVGMNDEIEDKTAIAFSVGFYVSICAGKDPKFSFEYAVANMLAKNKISSNIPVLWYNGKKVISKK